MKRAFVPSLFKHKRARTNPATAAGQSSDQCQVSNGPGWADDDIKDEDLPSETKAALIYLRSLFNVHHFEDRIPPILLKHQLYSVIKNKTQVDREVDQLREKKEIKLIRFGKDVDELSIVLTDDYACHVRKLAEQNGISPLINKFVNEIVENLNNITLTRQTICDVHGFTDKEITQLVNSGLLTFRDVGSWWLSIPGAGIFMKNFTKGRQGLLRTIRQSKYKEILQKELEQRKLQVVRRLGMMYHIHDIIGAELVTRIKTTSGVLLRLRD